MLLAGYGAFVFKHLTKIKMTTMPKSHTLVVCLCLSLCAFPTYAVQLTDNLGVGALVRSRLSYDPDEDIRKVSLEQIALTLTYKSDTWISDVRYWFQGKGYPYDYVDHMGDISFPEYAWVGYRFNDSNQLIVGLNKMPFGPEYYTHAVVETFGYSVGLEDTNLPGLKYGYSDDGLKLQAAYYPRSSWQGKGTSKHSRVYSSAPTLADDYVLDGSNNEQRNTFAFDARKHLSLDGVELDLGSSLMTAELYNLDTNQAGRRAAWGVDAMATQGPWGLRLQAARQVMRPRNDGASDTVTFGLFDGSYNVAARGNLYVAELSRSYDVPFFANVINRTNWYASYNAFDKSGGSETSQRMVLGNAGWVGKNLFIASEWIFGKNDPLVDGDKGLTSLAQGGGNRWENKLYVRFDYWF